MDVHPTKNVSIGIDPYPFIDGPLNKHIEIKRLSIAKL
jgi:hypothetical protein